MDAGNKLIRKIAFTTAATHDSTALEDLVREDERSLFGDKAYDRDSLKLIAGRKAGSTASWTKENEVTY